MSGSVGEPPQLWAEEQWARRLPSSCRGALAERRRTKAIDTLREMIDEGRCHDAMLLDQLLRPVFLEVERLVRQTAQDARTVR